jgi:hypothetical protein
MVELAKPYEIYEWRDGETREFTILRYEEGELEIHPRDGREAKTVPVLRIHVPPEEKPAFPQYWDMTSVRLVAQLKAMLPTVLIGPYKVTVTAIGAAPRTHFSVSRLAERPA